MELPLNPFGGDELQLTGIELDREHNDWAILIRGEYLGYYPTLLEASIELTKAIAAREEAEVREASLILKEAEAALDKLRMRRIVLNAQIDERRRTEEGFGGGKKWEN